MKPKTLHKQRGERTQLGQIKHNVTKCLLKPFICLFYGPMTFDSLKIDTEYM